MSNLTDLISAGGGGGSPFPLMVFQQSQTWACPTAMEALVFVIGAGGSGAFNRSNNTSSRSCSGGGGGGCVVSKLTLAAQNYTLTIGAGAQYVSTASGANGNAGGNSAMSGSGMTTMTAGGGAAGKMDSRSTATAGGSASGGTVMNNVGGAIAAQAAGQYTTSGGGGVSLWGSNADGTWNTSSVQTQVGVGGSPIGKAGIYASNPEYYGDWTYNFYPNQPVEVTPFPTIKFHQLSSRNGWGSNSSNSSGHTGFIIQEGTNYNALGNSPFTGGAGVSGGTGGAYFRAAAGIAGAGGGGVNCDSSPAGGLSGGGGAGLIIVCPISMGA